MRVEFPLWWTGGGGQQGREDAAAQPQTDTEDNHEGEYIRKGKNKGGGGSQTGGVPVTGSSKGIYFVVE